MGGVNLSIDPQKLKALMRLKPSLPDCAAFFDCSERSIERYIHTHFQEKFTEFREKHMVHTRLAIVRKAIDKAEKGDNVMLIFCLKNLCGWKDKWDNSEDEKNRPVPIRMTDEQFKEYVKLTIETRRGNLAIAAPVKQTK
jgi:hypothetical protein